MVWEAGGGWVSVWGTWKSGSASVSQLWLGSQTGSMVMFSRWRSYVLSVDWHSYLVLDVVTMFLFVYLMLAGTCSPWSMSHLYNESMVSSTTKNYMPFCNSVLFLLSVMWMISWMFELLNWNEMWWIHMSCAGLFMASWSWISCFAYYESNLFQNLAFWNPDGHWLTVL
jgi:hypothetical protein